MQRAPGQLATSSMRLELCVPNPSIRPQEEGSKFISWIQTAIRAADGTRGQRSTSDDTDTAHGSRLVRWGMKKTTFSALPGASLRPPLRRDARTSLVHTTIIQKALSDIRYLLFPIPLPSSFGRHSSQPATPCLIPRPCGIRECRWGRSRSKSRSLPSATNSNRQLRPREPAPGSSGSHTASSP